MTTPAQDPPAPYAAVPDEDPYPDVEDVLCDLLEDLGRTCTATGADLQTTLQTRPVIRVQRLGGPDDGITDYPRVAVDVFAATRDQARRTAEAVRSRITSGPLPPLDLGETEVGPHRSPYADEGTVVYTANYRLSARR